MTNGVMMEHGRNGVMMEHGRRTRKQIVKIKSPVIHTAQQVGESAPLTGETIRNAATRAKTRTKKST